MIKDSKIRILIAEDEPIIRKNICRTILDTSEFLLVGEVSSGFEAVEYVKKNDVDIILMDVEMDTCDDGLKAAKEIYAINPNVAVIMLTVHEDENTIYDAYCIESIKDYVVKSFDNRKVLAAIKRTFQDHQQTSSANEKMRHEFQRLKKTEHSLLMAITILSQMTPSEKEIIRLKLDGMSTRQIARKRMVEVATIKSQINSMLKKLGFTQSSQIVEQVKELKIENLFKN